MSKRKLVFYLSTGYEVRFGKDEFKFIDHLTNAIIGETLSGYGKSTKSWDTTLRMMHEEIEYVVDQDFLKDVKILKAFLKLLLTYVVAEKFKIILKKNKQTEKRKSK